MYAMYTYWLYWKACGYDGTKECVEEDRMKKRKEINYYTKSEENLKQKTQTIFLATEILSSHSR